MRPRTVLLLACAVSVAFVCVSVVNLRNGKRLNRDGVEKMTFPLPCQVFVDKTRQTRDVFLHITAQLLQHTLVVLCLGLLSFVGVWSMDSERLLPKKCKAQGKTLSGNGKAPEFCSGLG